MAIPKGFKHSEKTKQKMRQSALKRKILNRTKLIGQKFGEWEVLKFSHIDKNEHFVWICKCSCGKIKKVVGNNLISGNSTNCGCWRKRNPYLKHGMTKTRFHKIWQGIKDRCLNSNNKAYKHYGERGIIVCNKWLGKNGFINFKNDMILDYSEHCLKFGEKNTSIDRIDNNKGYNFENCRFATWDIQSKNRRTRYNKVKLFYKEKFRTLEECCQKFNIKYPTLYNRIFISKWSVEKALTTPTIKNQYD